MKGKERKGKVVDCLNAGDYRAKHHPQLKHQHANPVDDEDTRDDVSLVDKLHQCTSVYIYIYCTVCVCVAFMASKPASEKQFYPLNIGLSQHLHILCLYIAYCLPWGLCGGLCVYFVCLLQLLLPIWDNKAD